ncbi:MAG: amidase [Solirubrobacterales bacterium]|nr:amidase [Solirubrobacterales bacterium]
MPEPYELGTLEAATLLRARELSALELTQSCLQRIEDRNGGPPSFDGAPDAINAWVRLYPELACRQARAADELLRREADDAPLMCGIPVAVKDLYAIEGLAVTASSRVLEGNVARSDAIVWKRLRDQGAVLIGHTHTHEMAAGGTTDQVGNPWALDRIAGGSSGGSAAALAARMVPAALGSDTCGSLRIPSACCGTSAIKPSYGRLPSEGLIPFAPSLDHPGPMGRSVADCAVLLSAMAADGPAISPLMPPPAAIGELSITKRSTHHPLEGLTIALTDRAELATLDGPVASGLDAAREACERLGARVVELSAPWALDWADLSVVLLTEAWAYHARHADRQKYYRPAIAELMEAARNFTDAQAYLSAQERRRRGTETWEHWFRSREVDLVLEPTLPILPLERGPGYERGHAGGPGDPVIALTALWDMTGMPVVALPVSWDVGVSLIAPLGCEATVIQAALDLQEHGLGTPF